MTLEDMIYTRLCESAPLQALLADYGGRPAIFYQSAADASDAKWTGAHYPRIDFVVEQRADPLSNSAGLLSVSVWCDKDGGTDPEQLERPIRELLHATFAQPDDSPTECIVWQSSEAFDATVESEKNAQRIGAYMLFDVKPMPSIALYDPDPLTALNDWTKAAGYTVIGVDAIDGWLSPTPDAPAVYWTLTRASVKRETFACVWYDCELQGHIFAPQAADRHVHAHRIHNMLAQSIRVPMRDGSPLLIDKSECSADADPLNAGQLAIGASFGVLRS